jgi:major type 1 subunit fimbrin (pilin)
MKKLLLSAALATVFGVAALAPQAASATDGTITFNGKISSATCSIGSSGTPATGGSFTVTLPTVATSALGSASGTVAGITPFAIKLTGCSNLTTGNIKTYFEPGSTINTAGRLSTATGAGQATGVDLALLNFDQSAINLNTPSTNTSTAAVTSTSTSATLNYFVEYYNNGGTLAAGAVSSTVNYSIVYP